MFAPNPTSQSVKEYFVVTATLLLSLTSVNISSVLLFDIGISP